jgi:hypothetical protein
MNQLEELAARKEQLISRSDAERASIALTAYQWQARRQVARQVTGILKNPFVLAGLGLLLLKMPWRRTFRLSNWAWRGWRVLRTVQRLWI